MTHTLGVHGQCRTTRRHCYEKRHDITSCTTMTTGAASPHVGQQKPRRMLRDQTRVRISRQNPTRRSRQEEEGVQWKRVQTIHCMMRRSTAGIEKMALRLPHLELPLLRNRPPVIILGLLPFTAASGVCLDHSTHISFARVKVVIQRTVSVHVCLFVRVFSYTISFSALPMSSS